MRTPPSNKLLQAAYVLFSVVLVAYLCTCAQGAEELKTNIPALQQGAGRDGVSEMLAEKRKLLEVCEAQLRDKRVLLKAVEQLLASKANELATLSGKLERLKLTIQGEEDAKIKRLSKIYESMDPKRAAQIFDETDPATLVLVVAGIKEAKVAAIIANMQIAKAKELSALLARRYRGR